MYYLSYYNIIHLNHTEYYNKCCFVDLLDTLSIHKTCLYRELRTLAVRFLTTICMYIVQFIIGICFHNNWVKKLKFKF